MQNIDNFQDNELTALNGGGTISDMSSCLQVLDLHNNCLEKLPDEIGSLKQLKVSRKFFCSFAYSNEN